MKHLHKLIRMQNLRRVVQVACFLAFLYLFALTIGKYNVETQQIGLPSRAPIDTFFRIDPLLSLATMVSARRMMWVTLIYSLPIVVLTILAGRFFCGWICPLGTTLDATDTLFFRRRKKSERTAIRRNIKYYLLAGILAGSVLSSQFAYLLDPITIITRAFTFAIFPIVQLASRGLIQSQYIPSDVQYFFRLNFLAAAIFIAILAANSVVRRYWCRNLCPLGALLGILSKVSLVRRQVKSNCAHCGKCTPDCKMGAIFDDPTQYQATECIYCYSCTSVCPTLSTRIAPSVSGEGYSSEIDLNRRRVFQAMGVGALAAMLGRTNVAAKSDRTGRTRLSSEFLIRPPGSLPEDEFVDRCVRCSECMKVCPTNGLQPALAEAGIEGLWTPVLVPRIGECTQNCNLCSQVCSTKAISPFEIAEKPHIFIGRAVIDRSHCIAWNSGKQCLVCDECCSYHAVGWKSVDGVRRPFIDEQKCVGCGICENACPIQPMAAIRVFATQRERFPDRDRGR
ncbi:MAG: 4Fe-4S binding protein [Armatimonadota bacterium]